MVKQKPLIYWGFQLNWEHKYGNIIEVQSTKVYYHLLNGKSKETNEQDSVLYINLERSRYLSIFVVKIKFHTLLNF
ncbi:hypothetical protein JTE87_04372 [Bacillus amyloliquefaciens]|nr:hypothetical protein [Bacillus amyloliquefaciens]RHL12314.1 hypothetical protein DW032_18905 [Bacillus licheniformis]